MILKFNTELFKTEDGQIRDALTKIILELLEDRFLWDIENLDELFLSETGLFDTDYGEKFFSQNAKEQLITAIENIYKQSAYILDEHRTYLTTLVIGTGEDEIKPKDAYKIINQSSKVIVENATNDWKLIKGIAQKYANHKKRKVIYSLIKKAIDDGRLEAEQAGGKGQIIARIEDLSQNRYKGIYKFKLFTLFDSDRDNNLKLEHQIRLIIQHLKGKKIHTPAEAHVESSDLIGWHMLYKKAIENYLPVKAITDYLELTDAEVRLLNGLTAEQYDFIDFLGCLPSIDVKREFPELFLGNFTRDLFERRCEHHKVQIETTTGTLEQVSEIEELLLKLAKLI